MESLEINQSASANTSTTLNSVFLVLSFGADPRLEIELPYRSKGNFVHCFWSLTLFYFVGVGYHPCTLFFISGYPYMHCIWFFSSPYMHRFWSHHTPTIHHIFNKYPDCPRVAFITGTALTKISPKHEILASFPHCTQVCHTQSYAHAFLAT